MDTTEKQDLIFIFLFILSFYCLFYLFFYLFLADFPSSGAGIGIPVRQAKTFNF